MPEKVKNITISDGKYRSSGTLVHASVTVNFVQRYNKQTKHTIALKTQSGDTLKEKSLTLTQPYTNADGPIDWERSSSIRVMWMTHRNETPPPSSEEPFIVTFDGEEIGTLPKKDESLEEYRRRRQEAKETQERFDALESEIEELRKWVEEEMKADEKRMNSLEEEVDNTKQAFMNLMLSGEK